MTGEQIRAARTLLGWTAAELGEKAGVSYATIQRIDAAQGPVGGRHATVEAVRSVLEGAGVQFLRNGDVSRGDGVALKTSDE